MSKELVRINGGIVAVRFFDRMVDRETRRLSKMLQQTLHSSNVSKISMLLFIESRVPAHTPENVFQSLHFLKIHADAIDRIAIIGSKAWDKSYIGLFSLFGGVNIQFFERNQLPKAVQWLQPQPNYNTRLRLS
jgi:hypothetical protein